MKNIDDDYFSSRATVREFTKKVPSKELIANIVERASHAPNTGNMQLYTVVETRDRENLKRLAPMHFNQPAAKGAPTILTVCADLRRFERWCEVSKAMPGMRNLQMQLAAVIDAAIFAQQIVTVAETEGLGTCYMGTVTYNAGEIADLLHLPDGVLPVTAIAIGYPAKPGEKSERLPLAAVMHGERYNDFSDEEIKELYRAKDDYGPNKRFILENGKETLAQVFADVRYPKANNEEFSARLHDYLLNKGFSLDGRK